MTCWPNPPFWHYDAERMHFHSSSFPAFSLGLVMTPLELSRLQTHELSNFVSHYWREGEHVNLNNREQIPHCPHSLLHTQQNACRPALLGANWEGQKGSSSQLHPFTHTLFSRAGWLEQSNNTHLKKVLLPLGSRKLWRVCACAPPWLQTHRQGRAVGQSRIKNLADSSAIC